MDTQRALAAFAGILRKRNRFLPARLPCRNKADGPPYGQKLVSVPIAESAQQWVDRYGDSLYQLALSRVKDASAAEDLVQETLLAAILKHKIADHFRKSSRESVGCAVDFDQTRIEAFFRENGGWRIAPAEWTVNPGKLCEQKPIIL